MRLANVPLEVEMMIVIMRPAYVQYKVEKKKFYRYVSDLLKNLINIASETQQMIHSDIYKLSLKLEIFLLWIFLG